MEDRPLSASTLVDRLDRLWRRQSAEWAMLHEGVAALRQARVRTFDLHGQTVVAQNNPARVASTGSSIDPGHIAVRPCFLCRANRPLGQQELAYGGQWLFLCNPAPIFEPHFTIAHVDHIPQRIAPHIETMLQMAAELEGRYTVFYNGPQAGASAPDHLHFQASPAGGTPFEGELAAELCQDHHANEQRWLEWLPPEVMPGLRLGLSRPSHRPVVVLIGDRLDTTARGLVRVLDALNSVAPADPEPGVNLFATFNDDRWLVWLHPRRAHRPSFYGRGENQFLISPGAVDVAGLLITPRPEDFDRLDSRTIENVYAQVLVTPATMAALRDRLTGSTGSVGTPPSSA